MGFTGVPSCVQLPRERVGGYSDVPNRKSGQTFPFDGKIPKRSDRPTGEDGGEQDIETVCDHHAHQGKTADTEGFLREDPQVLEEDGELGAGQGEVVL